MLEKREQGGAPAARAPLFGGRYQGEKSILHPKSSGSPTLSHFKSDTYKLDHAPRSREVFAGCRGRTKANRGTAGGERTHLRAAIVPVATPARLRGARHPQDPNALLTQADAT